MKKKGFTLLELVYTMAIAAVLLSVASLSIEKRIDRNNFNKMKIVITEIFAMGETKSFNESEAFSILFDLSNSRLVTTDDSIDIPDYYSYSFYNVTRDSSGSITAASLLSSTEDVEFLTNTKGIYDKLKKASASSYTSASSTNHGAILVIKAKDSTVAYRYDIIPYSARTIIKRYLPNGATSSIADVGNGSKWTED